MKRTAIACLYLAALTSVLGSSPARAAWIGSPFISEYVEGSSFNKAVEIFNGTGSAIDLGTREFRLEIFSNGSATSSSTIDLSGVLASGSTFVVANTRADSMLTTVASLRTGSLNFNGDDALVLRKGPMILDVIGRVGEDPGLQWSRNGVGTRDQTLRRAPSVHIGDTDGGDPFDPSVGWLSVGRDRFDGLGLHSTSGTPTEVPTPAPIALLVLGLLGLAAVHRDRAGPAWWTVPC